MTIARLVEEAKRCAHSQRYDDALYIWRDICALGPACAAFRIEMAACLVELGAEDGAVFELETALALDSGVSTQIDTDERFGAILHRL